MKNRFERLYTESGKRLKDEVYDAYPRPQLKRDSYFNLNGFWQFCAVEKNLEPKYDQIIRVPFCPESILSGIEKTYKKGTKLCYKREFSLPAGFIKDKVFLHFGAVDQIAEVYLNGKLLSYTSAPHKDLQVTTEKEAPISGYGVTIRLLSGKDISKPCTMFTCPVDSTFVGYNEVKVVCKNTVSIEKVELELKEKI